MSARCVSEASWSASSSWPTGDSKQSYDWTLAMGARVCARARELGMITRPLGDVVTFLPPLATEPDDLDAMLGILGQAVTEATEGTP